MDQIVTREKTFVFVMIDNFSMLSFATAIEPLRIANRMIGRKVYNWRLLTLDGETALASNGIRLQVEGSIIAGQFESEAAEPDEYGMLFAKGNSLVPCVNTALEALRENGKLQEIEDLYLSQDGGIPTISD